MTNCSPDTTPSVKHPAKGVPEAGKALPAPNSPLPKKITIGDKYRPAMEITDQAEADAYFELCVEHSMSFGHNRLLAEYIERSNLGYFAGYSDDETRERIERLFRCAHPIFGTIAEKGAPTAEEAFAMGMKAGEKLREKP